MKRQNSIETILAQDQKIKQLFSYSFVAGFKKLIASPEPLSGKQLALVVIFLETIELTPGKTYYDETGRINPELRRLISRFLLSYRVVLGVPKPKTIITKKIINIINQTISHWPEDLQALAKKHLTKTTLLNRQQEISLLPYFFAQSLALNYQKKIKQKLLIQLGLSNYYYWTAYTILDDINDYQEKPESLAVALEFKRLGDQELNTIVVEDKTQTIINQIFSALHQALVTVPLIPLELSRKSLPHAIGPIIIMSQLNYARQKEDTDNWLSYMRNYLSARQLHDDLSDQKIDQETGNQNYVNDQLHSSDLARQEIAKLIKQGQKYLGEISIVKNREYFSRLLNKYFLDEVKSKKHRQEVLSFIRQYRRTKKLIKKAVLNKNTASVKKSLQNFPG